MSDNYFHWTHLKKKSSWASPSFQRIIPQASSKCHWKLLKSLERGLSSRLCCHLTNFLHGGFRRTFLSLEKFHQKVNFQNWKMKWFLGISIHHKPEKKSDEITVTSQKSKYDDWDLVLDLFPYRRRSRCGGLPCINQWYIFFVFLKWIIIKFDLPKIERPCTSCIGHSGFQKI